MSTAATSAINRLSAALKDSLAEQLIVTVSVKDAVRISGLAERTVRRYVAEGKLASTKVGTRRLLKYEDVKRFVRSGNGAA